VQTSQPVTPMGLTRRSLQPDESTDIWPGNRVFFFGGLTIISAHCRPAKVGSVSNGSPTRYPLVLGAGSRHRTGRSEELPQSRCFAVRSLTRYGQVRWIREWCVACCDLTTLSCVLLGSGSGAQADDHRSAGWSAPCTPRQASMPYALRLPCVGNRSSPRRCFGPSCRERRP